MISPFKIHISDERLAAIRSKVEAYDWSQLADVGGWSAGVGVRDLKRLVAYWLDSYDWREVEQRLNGLPNFKTDVEGEGIHFLHAKGEGSKAPVLLLHGWPGSYLEFERLIDPLVTDGHDVVVPSLPGFAFSQPITGRHRTTAGSRTDACVDDQAVSRPPIRRAGRRLGSRDRKLDGLQPARRVAWVPP